MQAEFGHYLLVLAFFMTIALSVIPMIGTVTKQSALVYSARPLVYIIFASVTGSFLCLEYAFLIDDFSVTYVAQHSNSLLPVRYKISAVWGGHEGSFLLWIFILSGWMFAVSIKAKALPLMSYTRILSVLGMITCGFLAFLIFTSNPFDRLLPYFPVDGSDLNPLLQDFGMIIHPPMLYMGYVGFAVSFAFAISSLIEGKWDATWARWTRPWTTTAWVFLTLGIALGSWWAYYELGWGGWWMWDPVENASFMPWLAGTALIHSLAVTDKRNSFKGWTLALALTTFSLCLLGTFLVRSGVITSVHSFSSDPGRGIFILTYLGIVIGASIFLFFMRSGKITKKVDFSLFSKDMFLLLNNILLICATFSVLYGTLYPMIAEAFGRKLSVGAPWFNMIFPVPMAVLLVLLGIGPLLNWKKHDFSQVKSTLIKQLAIALFISGAVTFFNDDHYLWVFIGVFLSIWVASSSAFFIISPNNKSTDNRLKFKRLSRGNLGMLAAHLGIAVTTVGIVITSFYSIERDLRFVTGKTVTLGEYSFKLVNTEAVSGDNYQASKVNFEVYKDNQLVNQLSPEKRHYVTGKQMMTEAAIDPSLWRDIYISLGEPLDKSRQVWAVRIYVKPFIRWIWLGTLLMGAGGLLAALDKRYSRKQKITDDIAKKDIKIDIEPSVATCKESP